MVLDPTQDIKTMRSLEAKFPEFSISRNFFRLMMKKDLQPFLEKMVANHGLLMFECVKPHEAIAQMELLQQWIHKAGEVIEEKIEDAENENDLELISERGLTELDEDSSLEEDLDYYENFVPENRPSKVKKKPSSPKSAPPKPKTPKMTPIHSFKNDGKTESKSPKHESGNYREHIPVWKENVEKVKLTQKSVEDETEEESVEIDPAELPVFIPDYIKNNNKRLRNLKRKVKLGKKITDEEREELKSLEADEEGEVLKKSFQEEEGEQQSSKNNESDLSEQCEEESSDDGVTYVKKHCCCRKLKYDAHNQFCCGINVSRFYLSKIVLFCTINFVAICTTHDSSARQFRLYDFH